MHRVPRTQKGLFAVFRLFNFIFHWLTINLRIFQLRKKKIQDTESLISSKLTDNSNSTVVFQTFDPFADLDAQTETVQKNLIHLRVLQRTGRKRITIVEGLSEKLDLKRILKSWKKDFHVNGSVITDDPKYEGPIIKISGDCRQVIYDFLVNEGLAEANQIKMHGA